MKGDAARAGTPKVWATLVIPPVEGALLDFSEFGAAALQQAHFSEDFSFVA